MSARKKILIADRFAAEAKAQLESNPNFDILFFPHSTPSDMPLEDIDALITRSRLVIDEQFLKRCHKLKVIISATSGFDHIDLETTQKRQIQTFYTPDGNRESTAELTWTLTLACARKLPQAFATICKGAWNRDPLIGTEISKKTYGIVGLGRIGSCVAQIAHGFNMNVLAYDPYKDDSWFAQHKCQRVSLSELLLIADVISIHVPYTPETHHMINAKSLDEIAPHAILVNTSRGQIINEQHLCEALKEGRIGAVGLDVFEHEPLSVKSPLFNFPNVVMAPHVGATTIEAFQRVSNLAADKVIEFFEGKKVSDALPPKEPWYADQRKFFGK